MYPGLKGQVPINGVVSLFCPSCSHFLDNMVAIWDYRRPYIPFASFIEHTDDVTGKQKASYIYSTSITKCVYIYMHPLVCEGLI